MRLSELQSAFFKANFSYFIAGKLFTSQGNTPNAYHNIPSDFSCVGVATSPNPQTDTYILSQLAALKIRRVRIDFTYGDIETAPARLLNKLIQAGYLVHLHLVQPFEEAKNMTDSEAQLRWQAFVESVCQQFGQDVALIEVGSTINRKRWAGYQLATFLQTWEIAHNVIKAHGITLAGPSITDFEPVYNIGFLSLFKAKNLLPDIHTNNLFSERCTEPERNDHKILGRRLAWLGKFRLVKKAHILNNISQNFGVDAWHSPSAFWTLPRIERLLPDSLEKQADYLARYMVLSAASGTMQSAGWGPLICHREGLIDDKVTAYPALERITYYASIGESVETYSLRPAFKALSQFNEWIQGAHYIGKLPSKDQLEIHAFDTKHGICHVVWTVNGKAAILSKIYDSACLPKTILSRDGNTVETPAYATESPIYIPFEQQPTLLPNSGPVPNLAIHRYEKDTQFYAYEQNIWRGCIAANNQSENALLSKALEPTQLAGPDKSTSLRQARNAIWTITDPRDSTQKLVVKQPVKVPWFKKITDKFKPSKGLRSWSGSNELLRRGIPNAKPIAYFEQVDDQRRTQNFYLCEFVASDFSVRELFSHYANGNSHFRDISLEDATTQVADFLFNMHQRGVFFRDLSGGNILITLDENNRFNFSLIDTGRAHFFNHPTARDKRLSDMARACNKLHTAGRNTLMRHYMSKQNQSFGLREKLPFILYNAKVIIKRKTKLKNILKALGLKKTK